MSYNLDKQVRSVQVIDETAGVMPKFKIIIPTERQRLNYRNKIMNCTNAKGRIDIQKISEYQKKVASIVIVGIAPPTKKEDGTWNDDGYLVGTNPLSSTPGDPGYQADWLERIITKRWPIVVALINETFEERAQVTNAEDDQDDDGLDDDGQPDDGAASADGGDPLEG